MKVLFLFAACIFALAKIASSENIFGYSDCTEEVAPKDDVLAAYVGWPYSLDCHLFFRAEDPEIFEVYESEDYFDPDYDEVLCNIHDGNGMSILNSSSTLFNFIDNHKDAGRVIFPDLQQGQNLNFTFVIKVPSLRKCWKMNIEIQLKQFEEQSCQEFLRTRATRPLPSSIGGFKHFSCEAQHNSFPKINVLKEVTNITYSWSHNCSQLPDGILLSEDNITMRIPSLGFNQAGIYVCSVQHNGMTIPLFSTSVCAQNSLSFSEPTITCQQDNYFQAIGDEVAVKCIINFGFGVIQKQRFHLKWKHHHGNDSDPSILCSDGPSTHTKKKPSCTFKIPEKKCYSYPPPEEERLPQPTLVKFELRFRNLQTSNFGRYESILTMGERLVRSNITIIEEHNSYVHHSTGFSNGETIGVAVGIAACVLLVIFVMVLCMQSSNKKGLQRRESVKALRKEECV